MKPNMHRLGIDIGKVIIKPAQTRGDTSFLDGSDEEAMKTLPNEGAFEAIAQLCALFEKRVWLVSKAGDKVAGRTRRWLRTWGFFEKTKVPLPNLYFCKERSDKRGICESLRITHFIDDRVDVLGHLKGVVPWLCLFGPQPARQSVSWVQPAANWAEVLALFSLSPKTLEKQEDLLPKSV